MSVAAETAPRRTPLDAALAYAARGWRVIPIPPGQKHPAIPAWQKAGTTDNAPIRHWWTNAPTHGVGIVTGHDTGLFVLDVDVADGKRGDDTLNELEASYGPLPATIEVVTGSGGRHLYFNIPAGVTISNDAGRKLGPGLDIRGEGGQVLAPPTIHPNGQPYVFEASCAREVADPPAWLIGLLTREDDPQPQRQPQASTGDRPGDLWAAETTWDTILQGDGWTLHHTDPAGEQHWTRPGKDRREGTSATVGYKNSDVMKVFTSSVPTLTPEATYTKIGYLAATRHQGDHGAAARALAADGWHRPTVSLEQLAGDTGTDRHVAAPLEGTVNPDNPYGHLPQPVDWADMWGRETSPEWLIDPVVPRARHVVLYAPAKMGKSLLALDISAAAATGRSVLGQMPVDPVNVVYLDLEMTEDDLRERLEDMGYDDTCDLGRLHYYSLPTLPTLNSPRGGDVVRQIADRHNADLVVIDTMARVVDGEENSADTYRDFDMCTSLPLKQRGTAVLRLDHSGKDLEKGQRGSSEKNGYADLVWRLTVTEAGEGTLTATHRRISWAPATVRIRRQDEPLVHLIDAENRWPEGTLAVVQKLDELGVPVGASTRICGDALKDAGCGKRRAVVVAACQFRDNNNFTTSTKGNETSHQVVPGTTQPTQVVPGTAEPKQETPPDQHRNHSGTTGTRGSQATVGVVFPRSGNHTHASNSPVWPHPNSTTTPTGDPCNESPQPTPDSNPTSKSRPSSATRPSTSPAGPSPSSPATSSQQRNPKSKPTGSNTPTTATPSATSTGQPSPTSPGDGHPDAVVDIFAEPQPGESTLHNPDNT